MLALLPRVQVILLVQTGAPDPPKPFTLVRLPPPTPALVNDAEPPVSEALPAEAIVPEGLGPVLIESAPHAGENIPAPAAATIAVKSIMGEVRLSSIMSFSGLLRQRHRSGSDVNFAPPGNLFVDFLPTCSKLNR